MLQWLLRVHVLSAPLTISTKTLGPASHVFPTRVAGHCRLLLPLFRVSDLLSLGKVGDGFTGKRLPNYRAGKCCQKGQILW